MKRWPSGTWMRLQSADTLKALIKQRNLSLDRMARYAGCSKSFISHLTAGRKTTCTATSSPSASRRRLTFPLGFFVPSTDAERVQNVVTLRENVDEEVPHHRRDRRVPWRDEREHQPPSCAASARSPRPRSATSGAWLRRTSRSGCSRSNVKTSRRGFVRRLSRSGGQS